MTAKNKILKIEGISEFFDGIQAFNRASFGVPGQETFGIIAPNRAGKPIVPKTVFKFLKPMNGKILLDDRDFAGRKPLSMPSDGITY